MKKIIPAWIVIASVAFSPLARADGTSEDAQHEQETTQTVQAVPAQQTPTQPIPVQATPSHSSSTQQSPQPLQEVVSPQEAYGDLEETYDPYEGDEDENPQGTPVSTNSNSEEKARKKEFWKNIIIAGVAVVVAVVSILVVSNNNGH
jgi:Zn-dependent metalloprotease